MWQELGNIEDDPEIPRIFNTEDDAANHVKMNGFGAVGTSLKYKTKNKNRIGWVRYYPCDNYVKKGCKKEVKIVHIYNERDRDNRLIFRVYSKGLHCSESDLRPKIIKRTKQNVMRAIVEENKDKAPKKIVELYN